MLRGRAVAAALCVLVPAARADLFGQDEDLCARVDADHSNMWEDQAHGRLVPMIPRAKLGGPEHGEACECRESVAPE